MDDLIKGVWPLMIAELLVLALMIVFPWTVIGPRAVTG